MSNISNELMSYVNSYNDCLGDYEVNDKIERHFTKNINKKRMKKFNKFND